MFLVYRLSPHKPLYQILANWTICCKVIAIYIQGSHPSLS